MSEPIAAWGAWDERTRNDPYPLFESMRAECPVQQVRLADGHDAWLVLGHEAARQALKDARLSKDIVAALDARSRRRGPRASRPGARAAHDEPRSSGPHPATPARVAGVRPHADRRTRTVGRAHRRRVARRARERRDPTRSSTSSRGSPTRCRSG